MPHALLFGWSPVAVLMVCSGARRAYWAVVLLNLMGYPTVHNAAYKDLKYLDFTGVDAPPPHLALHPALQPVALGRHHVAQSHRIGRLGFGLRGMDRCRMWAAQLHAVVWGRRWVTPPPAPPRPGAGDACAHACHRPCP
jgi:hypothetical protein